MLPGEGGEQVGAGQSTGGWEELEVEGLPWVQGPAANGLAPATEREVAGHLPEWGSSEESGQRLRKGQQ